MPKENQRVALSKRLLKDSVMELLQKKSINDISVTELCNRSEINRTTFYRHYQTPHDVLMDIEFDFIRNFLEPFLASKELCDQTAYITHMCQYICDHKDTAKLFIRNNTDGDMMYIFQNLSNTFFATLSVTYKGHPISTDTLRLMQTFFAYGTFALVRQWLIEDIPLPPENVAELIIGSFNQDFTFE